MFNQDRGHRHNQSTAPFSLCSGRKVGGYPLRLPPNRRTSVTSRHCPCFRRHIRPLPVSFFFAFAPLYARLDETLEQRVRLGRLRFELRMALDREEPRMVAQLDHFDQLAVGTRAGDDKPVGFELGTELVVELEAMAMAFL